MSKIDDWEEVPTDLVDDWEEVTGPKGSSFLSKADTALRGLTQGAIPFADEAAGGVGNVLGKLGAVPDMGYDYYRDQARKGDAEAAARDPNLYTGTQLGGAVATGFIPGLNISKAAGLSGVIGRSAAQGAIQGAGSTTDSLLSSEGLQDVALGGAIGGAGGLAGYGLGKGIEKGTQFLGKIPGKLDEAAEWAAAKALGAERGTINKLGKAKTLAAGRQALDEGVVSPLASTEDLIARNAGLKSRAGAARDQIYGAIDEKGLSTFNPLDVATNVEDKIGGFWRSPLNKAETNQFENTIESILMRGEGNIPLSKGQELVEELGKAANWNNNMPPTPKEQMARDAYKVVRQAISDASESGAKEVGIEGIGDVLKQVNSQLSAGKTADRFLQNKQAREQGNKLFGLTDAITAGGALGYGGATDDWKTAGAIVAGKKGLEKYGSQMAAVGADKLADVLRATPQIFGKFAPVLQQATQRGAQGLASTHFILQQTQPEYQKMLREMNGQDEN